MIAVLLPLSALATPYSLERIQAGDVVTIETGGIFVADMFAGVVYHSGDAVSTLRMGIEVEAPAKLQPGQVYAMVNGYPVDATAGAPGHWEYCKTYGRVPAGQCTAPAIYDIFAPIFERSGGAHGIFVALVNAGPAITLVNELTGSPIFGSVDTAMYYWFPENSPLAGQYISEVNASTLHFVEGYLANPIPEPATMALFASGLAGLALLAARRTRRR